MTPRDRAFMALKTAWETYGDDDAKVEELVTDAIMEAENAAYEKAAEIATDCGHISSDLARQRILACRWPSHTAFVKLGRE